MGRTFLLRGSALLSAVVLAAAVFAGEFAVPRNLAFSVLYVPAVVVTILSPRRTDALLAAGFCTLLEVLSGFVVPSAGVPVRIVMLNDVLALLAIWVTAAGVFLRVTSQRNLRDSQSELHTIVQTAAEGIITINDVGTIVSLNSAAERMFGYGPGELLGQNVRVLMPEPHRGEHGTYLQRYLTTGKRNIIGIGREVTATRKDGTLFPVDLGVGEWHDGRAMFTGILRDLTERKRLEAEVRQSQKLEAIGRLAGGIAHDFNNLLMGILGCARIAESADPSLVSEQVREIRGAAERGVSLTRQLLTFSRRRDATPEPVLVDEVIERLETLLARLLGEHVELRVHLRAAHGRVLIEPGQIEQILMNLAINSRDAMGMRGKLDVSTVVETCNTPGVGGIGGLGVGRYVAIEVSDDGCGMTEEVQAKAFDPFFTTKPPTEGTGLGLSTVYGVVRQVGGHLHLKSKVKQGTTFTLHLPITEAESGPRLPEREPTDRTVPRGRETVLVVEDDRLVRAGVRHILGGMGYEVLLASGGAEALRLCEEHPGRIDLLLTDILMPGMTGGELAREIASRLPGVRTLFMSALPTEVLVEQGRIDEGQLSIQKPFSDAELAAAIQAALAG